MRWSAGFARCAGRPAPRPLPFTGGWLLYLGYELAAEIEPRLTLPRSPDSISGLAIRTPAGWIRDRATGQSWVVAEAGHEGLLDAFEAHVRAVAGPPGADPKAAAGESVLELTGGEITVLEDDPERFLKAVTRALEYIAAGDVYQANLSRQWQVSCERPFDPVALYARLRSHQSEPVRRHDAPSRFFGDELVAGKAAVDPRGHRLHPADRRDAAARRVGGGRRGPHRVAASNEKERAEHVMLIDLERNDLGRVCVGGTVRVDEYMALETYAHVHHIVSNVSGRLRDDLSPIQAIRALFPGGHDHRMPQGALHGDHRGAGGRRAGRLHGLARILEPRRQRRSQHFDSHAHGAHRRAGRAGAGPAGERSPRSRKSGSARAPASLRIRVRRRSSPKRAPRPWGCCGRWNPAHEILDRRPARTAGRPARSRPELRRRRVRDHEGAARLRLVCSISIWIGSTGLPAPRAAGAEGGEAARRAGAHRRAATPRRS